MKVGLLSLPLTWNYGGILQQYALKEVLNGLGHNVVIISRRKNRSNPLIKFLVWSKWNFVKYLSYLPFFRINLLIACESFKRKHLACTSYNIFSDKEMYKFVHRNKFDAFIVGSDQVWSYGSPPHLMNYYLDFSSDMPDIKRIAYAASFGREEWTYSQEDTAKCAKLIHKFDAVSVREDSGVKLCEDYLNIQAIQLVDPTLLLDKEHYINIYKKADTTKSNGQIFTYILDSNKIKNEFINNVANELNMNTFSIKKVLTYDLLINAIRGIHPSVEQWIRSFDEAEFVITDSFHGTVFAIIFNKPFIAIGNKKRGIARFFSLLKQFNLENRLIENSKEFNKDLLNSNINWEMVNSIRNQTLKKSIDFFKENLKINEFTYSSRS